LTGAYEGLASAAIVLLKHDTSALPVQRNSSFSLRHGLSAASGSSLNSSAMRSEISFLYNAISVSIHHMHMHTHNAKNR